MKYKYIHTVEAVQVIKDSISSNSDIELDTTLNCFSAKPQWLIDLIKNKKIEFRPCYIHDNYELVFDFDNYIRGRLRKGEWVVLSNSGTKYVFSKKEFIKIFEEVK